MDLTATNPDQGVKHMVMKSEMFDILYEAHVSTEHGGEKKLPQFLSDKYFNITQKIISSFVRNCRRDKEKKTKTKQ